MYNFIGDVNVGYRIIDQHNGVVFGVKQIPAIEGKPKPNPDDVRTKYVTWKVCENDRKVGPYCYSGRYFTDPERAAMSFKDRSENKHTNQRR
jgi:hypothetical protein